MLDNVIPLHRNLGAALGVAPDMSAPREIVEPRIYVAGKAPVQQAMIDVLEALGHEGAIAVPRELSARMGVTGAAEIVYNKGRMIPCVLDNRITGMTGHQDNPGTGYTLQGDPTALLSVEKILTALGFAPVLTVDPQDLKAMKAAVDQAVDALDAGQQPAIVTRRPCLLIKRDKFRKGMCRVNADKCRSCRSCLKVGCPAISLENGKAVIDRTQCVGCTVCAQVCPFDAIEKEEK